jgi:glycerophosphoryl diester phosphodiesterase
VDRTSNGTGPVSTLELAQLNDLDFSSWKGEAEAPDVVDLKGGAVLTLDTLLDLVTSYQRPLTLAIETKHPTRYAGWVEQRTVEALERFDLARPHLGEPTRIRLMSFSVFALRRFGRLAPDLPRVALMDRVALPFRDGSLPMGVQISGPSIEIVRAHPRYPSRVAAQGRRTYCWTVDELDDVDRCCEAGVDAIITNRPRAVLDHLQTRA